MQDSDFKPHDKPFTINAANTPSRDVRGLFVIEMALPDGLHWFGGYKTVQREKSVIGGFLWSPYIEDILYFPNLESATRTLEILNTSGGTTGGIVKRAEDIEFWKAKFLPSDN